MCERWCAWEVCARLVQAAMLRQMFDGHWWPKPELYHPMPHHRAGEDVKLVPKGIRHFHNVSFHRSFEVFVVFFRHQTVSQLDLLSRQFSVRVSGIGDSESVVESSHVEEDFR